MGYELFRLYAGTKAQQRKKKISKAKKKPVCIDIEEEDREKDIMLGELFKFDTFMNHNVSRKIDEMMEQLSELPQS